MGFEIRRARSDEWRQMKAIRLRALAEAPTAFGSTLVREQTFADETWRARTESSMTFLAYESDRVVGTACGYVDPAGEPGVVQLVAMYVEPAARGQGCSHLLIDAVLDAAAAAGAAQVRLNVTDVNEVAARCYRRHGFSETGRTSRLLHSPEITEIEMMVALPRS
jgi:GNAT superfamily N-acetyltransferase